jgi:hypothetical protein
VNTTPLLTALAAGYQTVDALRITRHYADAPNYHGPRDVSPGEAAQILARHAAPHLLHWRRLLDQVPPLGQPLFLAGRSGEAGDGEPVVGEGSLEQLPSRQAFFWAGGTEASGVYAWASLPPALDLATIGSPLAR